VTNVGDENNGARLLDILLKEKIENY